MTNEIVALDQSAVRSEIERQITQVAAGKYSMTHNERLFGSIESVNDSAIKGELLHKYLDALAKHQGEKNLALVKEVESRIRINEQYVDNAIAKDKARSALFNSRFLVMFSWIFPILAGFVAVKFLDSYAFAVFIIIVLYGMLIALYFSQSSGLAETWKALTNHRRDL
jgi:hypothetical protein